MPPSDRRQKIKLFHIAQGRADAWIAARRYLTEREAAALAADLCLERHDLMHAEARDRDCRPCSNCGEIQSYAANHLCIAPSPHRPLPEREQT